MLISENTKLAEVILQNYHLIPVVSRFGIELGFGDKTAGQICEKYGIDKVFFLEIINAFNDKSYLPYKKLREMPLSVTVDYLLKSHRYYNKVKLPLIEKLIEQLKWTGNADKKNKDVLKTFFARYRKEVNDHTANEEQNVYPYILELEKNYYAETPDADFTKRLNDKSISYYADIHDELNTSLSDLKNIIIKYLHPADNKEITEQILTEIFRLEKDMTDHTKLEENVIIPVAKKMEDKLKRKIN
ncbi:MAG: hypothetical protein GXO50_02735 [Chlorobi bacterium]|nr:hypothetical protein [Chlorobiota bacterium]